MQEVFAPLDGRVWQLIDKVPENEPSKPNTFREEGNAIVLRLGDEEYLVLAHLKEGSFKTKVGKEVKKGEPLALTGFSGNISEPMVGLWMQSNILEQEGEAIKFYFSCVEILDGKNWVKKEGYFPKKGEILRACSN